MVTCHENEDVEVNVMHRNGNSWRWPKVPDKIFYLLDNIVRQINALMVVGSRRQFTFDDICFKN